MKKNEIISKLQMLQKEVTTRKILLCTWVQITVTMKKDIGTVNEFDNT